ncbi:MAG: CoA transferase [Brumimicrobium sp.]|nr:CoA transferase [Brumimicrobium sp.]
MNPFGDLKIIDLSTVLAGPSVGSFFAELGADVLKIEHPVFKDVTRSWKLKTEDPDSEISAYFSSVNYRKKYLQLDLKDKKDHAELMKIVKDADLVLMNFKKGDQSKLGITDDRLRKINKSLIIGKISGFGINSDRVAYDLILQAESGFMSMNGTPESGPVKMPVAIIDVMAAHHLKEGLLIELYERKNNTQYLGRTVSVSLYDAAVSSLINQASNYLMAGHVASRIGSLHPNIAPYGEIFTAKDGVRITFAIGSDRHFQILCGYLNIQDIYSDDRFKTVQKRVEHRFELEQIIQREVQKRNAKDIISYMHSQYVPVAELKNIREVFETPEGQKLIREEKIDGVNTRRITSVAFRTE